MDGFDPVAMSYLAAAAPLHGLQLNSNNDLLMPIDATSNFDNDTFVGSEDASQYGQQHSMQPPLTPSLKRFSHTYEDGFSDHLSQYEHSLVGGTAHDPTSSNQNGVDSPSIDRDHRLLSFSLPSLPVPILDFTGRRTNIAITAQLHGMFFLAESPWGTSNDAAAAPPAELTCYRRNLFQVTGNVMLPKGLRYVLTEQGEQMSIVSQELVVSATESVEQNAVKIISVPWKTPATSQPVAPVEDKSEKEPTTIPLDIAAGQEVDAEFTSIPIAWKRLQFRSATANNGRRKELQQHFVVHLKVVATLQNGSKQTLAEVISNAIIVRGRSPRNFQSRKDMPISGSASAGRSNHTKNLSVSSLPAQVSRTSTGDSIPQRAPPTGLEIPKIPFPYDGSDMQISPDFFEWQIPTGQLGGGAGGPMTSMPEPSPFSASFENNNSPAIAGVGYAQSSPDLSRTGFLRDNGGSFGTPQHRHTLSIPRAPVALSLTDDLGNTTPPPGSAPPQFSSNGAGLQQQRRSPTSVPAAPTLSQQHHNFLIQQQAQLQQQQAHLQSHQRKPDSPPRTKAPRLSPQPTTITTAHNPHMRSHINPTFSLSLLPPTHQHSTSSSSPEAETTESADLLYEYFPLGLDDWMPPVDAVYRPHVVHHVDLPGDPGVVSGMRSGFFGGGVAGTVGGGDVGGRRRSKRYFSEDGI